MFSGGSSTLTDTYFHYVSHPCQDKDNMTCSQTSGQEATLQTSTDLFPWFKEISVSNDCGSV